MSTNTILIKLSFFILSSLIFISSFAQERTHKRTWHSPAKKSNECNAHQANIESHTSVYFNRFRGFKYGAYTVPVRLRKMKDKFEFNSNLSLGANVIARFGSRVQEEIFLDVSCGIGLTKVDLNSENSILGSKGSDFENINILSPTALTITLGALINLAENVNIGLYTGWDKISSADNKVKWIYNGKPWLGIGLNISFVS